MALLNIKTEQINLIISYESQQIKRLKCKMTDKIKDILSKFGEREKVDYSSFLILYSGKAIQGPDLEKTFSQIITKNDKEQKTMNILIYSNNPVLISGQNFIKIILIINSKEVFELQGKKDDTIKDIINKNFSKIGKRVDSLIIKYDMNEIDLNKKFDEIANERDKKHSGITLSAYTSEDKLPNNNDIEERLTTDFKLPIKKNERDDHNLIVKFIDEKNKQLDIINCMTGDKIKDIVEKFCIQKKLNIHDYKYKYEINDNVDLDQTFDNLFNTNFELTATNAGDIDSLNNNNKNIPDNINIKIIKLSCFKKHKKLIIIISIIIIIILISSIIIYIILNKKPNKRILPDPVPSIINDTIITTNIINDTAINSVIINETIKENSEILQSQSIKSYIQDTIRISHTIIQSIIKTFNIIDTTKESQTIINTNKKEPKKCDSGYFIPDNDDTLEDCQRCSIKGCINCHGTYESNICTNCGNLRSVSDKNNKIIECSNSCEIGEEEKCLTCYEDKLGCKSCNIGYKLVNGTCRPDHLLKAIYKTDADGDTIIKLFGSTSKVNKLIIDGENVPVKNEYQFPKKGNHTVYIKFPKINTYINNYNFFSGNEKLISVVFSDFDEYISDISFERMFKGCTSLISVDLSRISINLNSELYEMFSGCTNLIYVNFNFKSIFVAKSIYEMFLNCKLLTSLDLSSFNVSKVKSFSRMFAGCSSLRKINLKSFKLDSVTSIDGMFKNCISLEYLELSSFKPFKLAYMNSVFYNCNSLTSINLDNFYTNTVTSMELLFYNCRSLKLVNITSFNTESVTNMDSMFEQCISLTSIIFGKSFNTNKVTRMGSFFSNCQSLKAIDYPLTLSKSLFNITSFFSNCYSLTSINFQNFNSSNVKYYDYMFRNCYSLKNINIPYINFKNFASIIYMFMGCYSLTSIDFSSFKGYSLSYNGAFFNCPNLKYINFSSVNYTGAYNPLFNSNISSNGTIILNTKLYNSQKNYIKIPSNWTLKLI